MHWVRACSRPAVTGPSLLSCSPDDPVRGPHHSMWSAVWPSSELDHAGPHVVAAPVPSPGLVAVVVRTSLSLVIPYLQPLQK